MARSRIALSNSHATANLFLQEITVRALCRVMAFKKYASRVFFKKENLWNVNNCCRNWKAVSVSLRKVIFIVSPLLQTGVKPSATF